MYQFIKPFLDNKMSIFEGYCAFNGIIGKDGMTSPLYFSESILHYIEDMLKASSSLFWLAFGLRLNDGLFVKL